MNEHQQGVLRLQPHMIPNLRAAFADAVTRLNDTVVALRREGSLHEPWLGDETSDAVAAHYSQRAMDAPDSSYEALTAYRNELGRVHDTLQQMENDYRRREGDNAALWGRRA